MGRVNRESACKKIRQDAKQKVTYGYREHGIDESFSHAYHDEYFMIELDNQKELYRKNAKSITGA